MALEPWGLFMVIPWFAGHGSCIFPQSETLRGQSGICAAFTVPARAAAKSSIVWHSHREGMATVWTPLSPHVLLLATKVKRSRAGAWSKDENILRFYGGSYLSLPDFSFLWFIWGLQELTAQQHCLFWGYSDICLWKDKTPVAIPTLASFPIISFMTFIDVRWNWGGFPP